MIQLLMAWKSARRKGLVFPSLPLSRGNSWWSWMSSVPSSLLSLIFLARKIFAFQSVAGVRSGPRVSAAPRAFLPTALAKRKPEETEGRKASLNQA